MTFLLSEDEALRDRMLGMTVSDEKNSSRAVGVWFGQPDPEIRQQSFPYVTVNMIDISEARERVMNAEGVKPWYYAPDINLEKDGITYDDWSMPMPIPVDITYQVTSFARQPRHDRQILKQILGVRLPFRFGSLSVKEINTGTDSWDATVRRLDMLDVAKRDTVESGKRMFMNIFTIRVSSEIPSPYVWNLFKKVETVDASLGVYPPLRPLTATAIIKESIHIAH
jgi:hypothetical protein